MRIEFLSLKAIHDEIEEQLTSAAHRVINSGWFVLGRELEDFESAWAQHLDIQHAVGVASGLDALELSLRALAIGSGEEVIVPSLTFVATWNAVVAAGATPVGADVDPCTGLITGESVARVFSPRTRAVIPVHLYGAPAPVNEIREAVGNDVALVLDAAQAHGTTRDGRSVAHDGLSAFSFYPGKNLGALGDGGAVTTDDNTLAREIRRLRNYGALKKYDHEGYGRNSRLDEIQAAFLNVKLNHLSRWQTIRARQAAAYDKLMATLDIPVVGGDIRLGHGWHLYVIRVSNRVSWRSKLRERGIETGIHYPRAVPDLPAFLGATAEAEVARQLADEVLSLPFGPHMNSHDVDYVLSAMEEIAATSS